MALRTFHSNPALGGFGSESTVLWVRTSKKACPVNRDEAGDAFAQILKEVRLRLQRSADAASVVPCERDLNCHSAYNVFCASFHLFPSWLIMQWMHAAH